MTGLFRKKFRGLRSNVMGSTGMIGKSSGEGKCTTPKVCQRTISSLSTLSFPSPIHSGRPTSVSPDVWGTCRPAGQSWSSRSMKSVRSSKEMGGCEVAEQNKLTLRNVDSMPGKARPLPNKRSLLRQQPRHLAANKLIASRLLAVRVQLIRVTDVPRADRGAVIVRHRFASRRELGALGVECVSVFILCASHGLVRW